MAAPRGAHRCRARPSDQAWVRLGSRPGAPQELQQGASSSTACPCLQQPCRGQLFGVRPVECCLSPYRNTAPQPPRCWQPRAPGQESSPAAWLSCFGWQEDGEPRGRGERELPTRQLLHFAKPCPMSFFVFFFLKASSFPFSSWLLSFWLWSAFFVFFLLQSLASGLDQKVQP